jgi:hypothetical protein
MEDARAMVTASARRRIAARDEAVETLADFVAVRGISANARYRPQTQTPACSMTVTRNAG